MKILQISSAETFGGGEKHLCELTAGLRELGLEVDVAVRPSCEWKDRAAEASGNEPFTVPLRGSFDLVSSWKLAGIGRAADTDIFHAHLARDYVPASIAARLSGKPLVITRHVLFPISFLTRSIAGNASRIIAVSSGVEDSLVKGFSQEKIEKIPNGIDTGAFDPARRRELSEDFRERYEIPPGARIVTSVGELSPVKGQDDLVLAAAEVFRSSPEAYFVIVGRDNSRDGAFKRKLRRLVKVSGLEPRFLFLDWVEDTAPLLSAAEVFVSASRSESFGLAILEAMAACTPVAATRTAGAAELLDNDSCGLLSDIGDIVALAENISRLLSEEDLARGISEIARERAEQNFSIDKMVEATAVLYKRVLSERPGA